MKIVKNLGERFSLMSSADAIRELKSHATGLTNPEAQRRMVRDGPNVVANRLQLDTVTNLPAMVRVRRSDRLRRVPLAEVVVGDIVLLHAGEVVPADMRVMEVEQCVIDPSPLFGGNAHARVYTHELGSSVPVHERHNILYASTTVTSGSVWGVVFATGNQTELGRIASFEPDSAERQERWQKMASYWYVGLLTFVIILSIVSWFVGYEAGVPQSTVLSAILSLLIVALLPALPLASIISLGKLRWQLRHVRTTLKGFSAMQQLAKLDILLVDAEAFGSPALHPSRLMVGRETYRLTPGSSKLTIGNKDNKQLSKADKASLSLLFDAAVLSAGPADAPHHALTSAMHELAIAGDNTPAHRGAYEQHALFVHDAHRGIGSAAYLYGKDHVLFAHGSVSSILSRCTKIWDHGHVRPLSDGDQRRHASQQVLAAAEGRQSVALAYRILPTRTKLGELDSGAAETSLIYLGSVELESEAHTQITQTLQALKSSNIKVSLLSAHAYHYAITSQHLASMDDEKIIARLRSGTATFANLTHDDVLRLVKVGQSSGHTVGVAGHTLTHLPGMRQANVSFASLTALADLRGVARFALAEPATIAPLLHLADSATHVAELLTSRLIALQAGLIITGSLSVVATLMQHVPPALTPFRVLLLLAILVPVLVIFSLSYTKQALRHQSFQTITLQAIIIGISSYAGFLAYFWLNSLNPAFLSPDSSFAVQASILSCITLAIATFTAQFV